MCGGIVYVDWILIASVFLDGVSRPTAGIRACFDCFLACYRGYFEEPLLEW